MRSNKVGRGGEGAQKKQQRADGGENQRAEIENKQDMKNFSPFMVKLQLLTDPKDRRQKE